MVSSTFLYSVVLSFGALVLGTPFDKRAGGLTVKLSSAASAVDSVHDLKISATITNTGSEALKLLKYGTILDDKLPTKSFAISKDGKAVPFTGVKLSVSLSDVDDSAFAVVNPGQTITTTHDIAALYDFASVGTGSFTFQPLTDFLVADGNVATAKVVENGQGFSKLTSEVTSDSLTVQVTKDVAKREPLEKRATSTCTTSSRKSFIDASYTEAKALARTGSSYVTSRGASDALYRAYWGANPTSRVTSTLNAVANENSSSRSLNCNDPLGVCTGGVIAYTVIATTNIYFCSIFYNEVATTNLCSGTTVASRNVRGGTTLHELTHAVANTDDVTYGCAADQALSDSRKIINADNFNCFVTQVYASTVC